MNIQFQNLENLFSIFKNNLIEWNIIQLNFKKIIKI